MERDKGLGLLSWKGSPSSLLPSTWEFEAQRDQVLLGSRPRSKAKELQLLFFGSAGVVPGSLGAQGTAARQAPLLSMGSPEPRYAGVGVPFSFSKPWTRGQRRGEQAPCGPEILVRKLEMSGRHPIRESADQGSQGHDTQKDL